MAHASAGLDDLSDCGQYRTRLIEPAVKSQQSSCNSSGKRDGVISSVAIISAAYFMALMRACEMAWWWADILDQAKPDYNNN